MPYSREFERSVNEPNVFHTQTQYSQEFGLYILAQALLFMQRNF